MEIIRAILPIIGIVLLCIVGLFLLLVFLFLFAPLQYRIQLKVQEETIFHFSLRCLLPWIKCVIDIDENETKGIYRYLFDKVDLFPTVEEKTEQKEIKIPVVTRKLKKKKNKMSFKTRCRLAKSLLTDDKHKKAIRMVIEEVFKILKRILPKNSKLIGTYSAGSPDLTGQIFGGICILPMVYSDNWKIQPDFESEEMYFKGSFEAAGRIYMFRIIQTYLKIITDYNYRRLDYYIKRAGGLDNGRGK